MHSARSISEDRLTFKLPFPVEGNQELIKTQTQKGTFIRIDSTRQFACACFESSSERDEFKKQLA